jgi:hypothetical protein
MSSTRFGFAPNPGTFSGGSDAFLPFFAHGALRFAHLCSLFASLPGALLSSSRAIDSKFTVLNYYSVHRDNVNGAGRAIANGVSVAGGGANNSIESCTTACFNAGYGIAGAEYAEYVFNLPLVFFQMHYTQRCLILFPPRSPFSLRYAITFSF